MYTENPSILMGLLSAVGRGLTVFCEGILVTPVVGPVVFILTMIVTLVVAAILYAAIYPFPPLRRWVNRYMNSLDLTPPGDLRP
jgi:hypothetical protein